VVLCVSVFIIRKKNVPVAMTDVQEILPVYQKKNRIMKIGKVLSNIYKT
jgi:hypothetical protein